MRLLSCILFVLITVSGCHQGTSIPSGKARNMRMEDSPDSFSGKPRRGSRAPQMGFYFKKPKESFSSKVSFKFRYMLASKKKKHSIGNEQLSTSQAYNNGRQSESLSKMNQSFTKGRLIKRRKGIRNSDNTSDAFAKNPNKKERKGLFRRK